MALALWWRRREAGALGAPPAVARAPLAAGVFVLLVLLGVLLPLLGLSMLVVLLLEKSVLRRLPAARRFLGLNRAARPSP